MGSFQLTFPSKIGKGVNKGREARIIKRTLQSKNVYWDEKKTKKKKKKRHALKITRDEIRSVMFVLKSTENGIIILPIYISQDV